MRLVGRIIRHSPRQFIALTGWAIFIFCIVPIPLGVVTREVFNALTRRSAGSGIWIAIAIVAGMQISQISGELGLVFPWSAIQQRTASLLQHDLMAGVLHGYGRYGLAVPPAAAVARFRDEPGTITSGSLDAVCDLIGRATFGIVAAVVMWRINSWATLAAFAPVLVTSTLADALGSRAATFGAAARQATADLSCFLGEVVAGHLAVTAGRANERVVDRARQIGRQRRRLALRDTVFSQMLNSLNFHVVNVGTGVVLLVVASAVRRGRFSVGDLALFVVFLDQLTYLPAEIGRLISELKQTEKALDRMHAVAPGEEREAIGSFISHATAVAPYDELEPLEHLEVSGLSYHHRSSGRGITGISFALERGTLTVVTGRIGSGKTTLLHVLLGLLPLDAGQLRWNGRLIDDPAALLVPPRAAFTPQVPRLFSETLRDNLELGRTPATESIQAAMKSAVLDRDVAGLEAGLETLVGPRGVKLSGGQIQRAAAARMFLMQADLLVIDDLSSALDSETETAVWDRLIGQLPAVTCLAVSHRPIALRRADQVLVLDEGRLARSPESST